MNIDSCKLFLRAVDMGSLTAAAEQSGYTQSALSHIVASLEKEFGFPLLKRSKAGVSLTQDGERLMPHIRAAVNASDMVLAVADEIKGLTAGKVRVGAFSSVAICVLPEIIRDFNKKYPNIELDLRVDTYKMIEEWLFLGETDCGFLSNGGSRLDFFPLTEDRMLALLPEEHPLFSRRSLPLDFINGMDFIVPGEGTNYDIGRLFRSAGIKPRVRYAVSDDYAAIAMVKKGLGMTIVPELILEGLAEEYPCAELEPACTRTIGIATPHGAAVSPATRAFVEFVKKRFAIGGGRGEKRHGC